MFFKPEDALKFNDNVKATILRTTRQTSVPVANFTVENAKQALDYIAEEAAKFNFPWYKAMRPHDLIKEISHFKVPDGDYSIGVEIEHSPRSAVARRSAVEFLKDVDYACIDSDAGNLEATFPPILLSQLSTKWAAAQYLDHCANEDLMKKLNPSAYVGIHVNVGSGKNTTWKKYLAYRAAYDYGYSTAFSNCLRELGVERRMIMFGRDSTSYHQQNSPGSEWIEMRMFHTTTDSKLLLWYAVCACTMMYCLNEGIVKPVEFAAALDAAYEKHWGVVWNNVEDKSSPRDTAKKIAA